MESLVADLRYALRTLRRDRGFTAVTSASLAIGIGAVTLAFAVLDAVEFRPLPFHAPHELVAIAEVPRTAGDACRQCSSSAEAVEVWRSQARSFRDLAVIRQTGVRHYDGGQVSRILTADVSANFFSVLGVTPMLGRAFSAEETAANARVIVLAHDYWLTQLGADSTIVGRRLDLEVGDERGLYTVVGIMPSRFRFVDNEAWLPLDEPPSEEGWSYIVVGRLLPDAGVSQAAAEVGTLFNGLAVASPETHGDRTATALPLRDWIHQSRPNVGRGRFLLLGITLFVLLVAALNVASLNISRARIRFRDASIRSALGATRARLIRQFLTESLALTAVGGGLGVLIAAVGSEVVSRQLELGDAGFRAQLDVRVLTFALLTTAVAGVGAGMIPAWYGTRTRVAALLGRRDGSGGWRGARLQSGLVVLQIAFSLFLLTAGGLVGTEILRLLKMEPGFDPGGLYLVTAHAPDSANGDQQRAYAHRVRSELAETAGVVDLGLTGQPVRQPSVRPQRRAEMLRAGETPMVALADSAFFAVLGTRPFAGRLFTAVDRFGSPPVAIVNQTAAARLWPGTNPVGARMVMGESDGEVVEVVGVVRDVKVFNAPLKEPVPPIIYRPFAQAPSSVPIFVAKAGRGAPRLAASLRTALARVTYGSPGPNDVVALEEMHREETSQERLRAVSLNAFAALGLFLASIGMYGIMAYATSQRRREIGIRMACGGTPRRLRLMLLREGLFLAGSGLLIGVLGSLFVARGMRVLLIEASAADAWVLGGAPVVLALVLGLASLVPAYRATRIDLGVLLRD